MGKDDELRKVFNKRNFYTTNDASKVYLYALILPLIVGLVFSYVAIAIANGIGVQFADKTNIINELMDYLWFSLPYMLLTQGCFLGIYFVYNKFNRIDQRACNVHFKKINIVTCLVCVFIGVVAVLGFNVLINGVFGNIFEAIGIKSNDYELPNNTVGWYFLNILIAGIIPPICEELIFRGIIFQGLRERFSPIKSVLLTGLLFALMHENILQFVYPLILGIVLTIVMNKTNNLIYPMIIHAFNNITTITLDFLVEKGVISLNLIGMPWWLYIIGIIAAIATFAIFFLLYKFYFLKKPKVEIEKEGEAPVGSKVNVGKFPLTLLVGMLIAAFMIVINAV